MVLTRRETGAVILSLSSVGLSGCMELMGGSDVRGGELLIKNEVSLRHEVSTTMVAVGGNVSNRFESVDELEPSGKVVYVNKMLGGGDVAAEYDATVTIDGEYSHTQQFEIEGEDGDVEVTVEGPEQVSIDVDKEISEPSE